MFLGGNELPQRWQGRRRFVVLETGFGLGHNFLATWAAWRSDARRCDTLWFVAIDRHPPQRDDLRRAHGAPGAGPAAELVASWPPQLPGLHLLDFEAARLRLLLAFGDVRTMLRELVLQADAVFLDGFAPDRNPAMWDRHLWPLLARRCAAGSTAATWSVARDVRDGLASAGWAVQRAPGFGGKREMTVARFEPRFFPPCPPGRRPAAVSSSAAPSALIVGAGLAGAAAASALARAGWACTVIDRASAPARGASGNPAGVFHGLVQGANGPHARLLRAAAGFLVRSLPAQGFEGACSGLLRVADDAGTSAEELARRSTRALGFALPADWAQALDTAGAAACSGVTLNRAAWFTPAGGWLAPAPWVREALAQSGATLMLNTDVAAIERSASRWQAMSRSGRAIAEADVVVLANAADAARLAGACAMPVTAAVRGQVTLVPGAVIDERPRLPLAGNGTLIPLPDGRLLAGASWHPDDSDTAVRAQDHAHNLAQMQRLLGGTMRADLDPALLASSMSGRVAFRCTTADRLPVIGPLPAADAAWHHQVRHIVRAEGLYAFTALGSRGITLAPLAGEILASWITGAPMPVEAPLLDAIDPARARPAPQG